MPARTDVLGPGKGDPMFVTSSLGLFAVRILKIHSMVRWWGMTTLPVGQPVGFGVPAGVGPVRSL